MLCCVVTLSRRGCIAFVVYATMYAQAQSTPLTSSYLQVSCLFQLPPPKTAADRALERKRIKSEAVGNQSDYIALDPKSNRIVLFASQVGDGAVWRCTS